MSMTPLKFTRSDGSTFTLTPTMPGTYAALFDLGAAAGTTGPKLLRAYTAAIGLGLVGQAPESGPGCKARLPAYRNDGDITAYGGAIMEVLAGQWRVAHSDQMWAQAVILVGELLEKIPTQEGINEATNFTSPSEDA
jgi:hypothetical protein